MCSVFLLFLLLLISKINASDSDSRPNYMDFPAEVMENPIKDYGEQIKELESQLIESQFLINMFSAIDRTNNQEIVDLQTKVELYETNVKEREQEIKRLQADIATSKHKESECQIKFKSQPQHEEETTTSFSPKLSNQCQHALQIEMTSRDDNIANLQNEINRCNAEEIKLKSETDSNKFTIQECNSQINSKTKIIEHLNSNIISLQKQIESSEKSSYQSIQNCYSDMNSKEQRMNSKITDLEHQFYQCNEERISLKSEKKSCESGKRSYYNQINLKEIVIDYLKTCKGQKQIPTLSNSPYAQVPATTNLHRNLIAQAQHHIAVVEEQSKVLPLMSGLIPIQRRIDGKVDFSRTWYSYRNGFGVFDGEFFIGLEKIYQMTSAQPHELFINLEDWQGKKTYAHYDNFAIGSEDEHYMLKSLGTYGGSAGDSMGFHIMQNFSTYDRNNGRGQNCAQILGAGWWYSDNCQPYCNLNGQYFASEKSDGWYKGIVWLLWHQSLYSLKSVNISIRPRITPSNHMSL